MKIWIISDTHFGHENIIKYASRPFKNALEMDQALIANWNRLVGPDDLVYHLGDFAFGPVDQQKALVKQLNGKILLIRGNHDRKCNGLIKLGFAGVLDEGILKYHHWTVHLTHHKRPTVENVINLHGHTHLKERFSKGSVNMSVEAWDYTPVLLDEVLGQYSRA